MNQEDVSTKKVALNPTVVKLGVISFFTDVASEMLYPITPIFLTSVLGASLTYVGLIEGVAESIASLLKTYSGVWSDRIEKRRPFILIGYFLGAISKPLIGFAHSWPFVLLGRGVDRTGKGLRSAPRDALLAESVSPNQRGAAFGWHRGMDTLGATVGPLLALFFLELHPLELRPLYFWAMIPGLISVLLIFSIKETPHKKEKRKIENPFKLWQEFTPAFKCYIIAWGVFSFTNSSDVFLLLKAKNQGLTTSEVILLYCSYNLTYSLSSPYLGKLSDRIGRRILLISGLVIFVLVYLGFAFAHEKWHFWSLFVIYGLYMGATEGVGKAFVVDLAPESLKATGVGILGTVSGINMIFASVFAGVLWDKLTPAWTFYYGAMGAFIAIILLNIPELRRDSP